MRRHDRTFPNKKRKCTNRTRLRALHTQHCNSVIPVALFHLPVTIPRQKLWTQHPQTLKQLDILDHNLWPRLTVLTTSSPFNYLPRIRAQYWSFTGSAKTQAPHPSTQAPTPCTSECRGYHRLLLGTWERRISWSRAGQGLEPQSFSRGNCVYPWRTWLYLGFTNVIDKVGRWSVCVGKYVVTSWWDVGDCIVHDCETCLRYPSSLDHIRAWVTSLKMATVGYGPVIRRT
jgi:hypothetical protein